MNRSALFFGISAAALLVGAVALLGRSEATKPREDATPSAEALAAPRAEMPASPAPVLVAPPPVPSIAAPSQVDEASVMNQLRGLVRTNPAAALELSRSSQARLGETADAAERSWIIVKSLSELGRHEEARAEGKLLLERYRDTRWAEDVYRHLFVNPPTHPAERGYGKTLELE